MSYARRLILNVHNYVVIVLMKLKYAADVLHTCKQFMPRVTDNHFFFISR